MSSVTGRATDGQYQYHCETQAVPVAGDCGWGDVSSERAIVRTRNISCLKDGKTIDMPIKGHVSFRGKNGIKGEVVMRNGKILGWAWGAGFVDGIGQGMERASQPAVGLGATAAYGAGDVLKMGIGGRPCDDGADRWSGVVCRKIITPFLARGFFPDVLCLSSGCAGRSGAVTGMVSLAARG